MTSPLHVLIVEDSEDDMLLLLRELRRGGYRLDYLRVDSAIAMQVALDRQSWDIIIADYTLPTFSAPEALSLLQAHHLDLPFIIVSGTIGEELAVAAMKAGAHDYIIKGNLARLVPAVERELREAEERQKRLQAEQSLRESEQKVREQAALLDIATDAIFVRDLNHHILLWNRGAERLYGWFASEALGKNALELLYRSSDTWPTFSIVHQQLLQTGKWQGELRQVTKLGRDIVVESRWTLMPDESGQPKSILTVSTDITEKKQLEAQFLRAQRLESLGTLASGIAHDFNNILTPILAAAQLLSLKLSGLDDRNQQLLRVIEASAKRGANLIKQILAFARGVEGKCVSLQVKHLISEVVQVVRQTFPKNIEISHDFPSTDLWMVAADATHLHQVLMNLCVNARDAMPAGGELSLFTENQQVEATYTHLNCEAHPGPYVMIKVTDTGIGMPPELLDRIFDPFFTTKEPGKGTGLGLSTVLGIVKNHGGFIQVQSEVDRGTEFKIFLPAIEDTAKVTLPDAQSLTGHQELILVVDDEPLIRQVTQTVLETHNYRALIAKDGLEAIALYTQNHQQIRAILIDMMMPTMDGLTAIGTLQTLNPQVPVIAMSGLMANSQLIQASGSGVQAFLAKPYTQQELLETLQQVLAEG